MSSSDQIDQLRQRVVHARDEHDRPLYRQLPGRDSRGHFVIEEIRTGRRCSIPGSANSDKDSYHRTRLKLKRRIDYDDKKHRPPKTKRTTNMGAAAKTKKAAQVNPFRDAPDINGSILDAGDYLLSVLINDRKRSHLHKIDPDERPQTRDYDQRQVFPFRQNIDGTMVDGITWVGRVPAVMRQIWPALEGLDKQQMTSMVNALRDPLVKASKILVKPPQSNPYTPSTWFIRTDSALVDEVTDHEATSADVLTDTDEPAQTTESTVPALTVVPETAMPDSADTADIEPLPEQKQDEKTESADQQGAPSGGQSPQRLQDMLFKAAVQAERQQLAADEIRALVPLMKKLAEGLTKALEAFEG